MVDRELLTLKASAVRRHVRRARQKAGDSLEAFKADLDRQDIVIFNLQQAVQNCIDIAAHVIAEEDLDMPPSSSEMFYLLLDGGYLPLEIVDRMVRAIGFRNLVTHEYVRLDLDRVNAVATRDSDNLEPYLSALFRRLGLASKD